MKKMSKRMLSVLLAALLVITSLPLVAFNAMADDYSDLAEQIERFETDILAPMVPTEQDGQYVADYTKIPSNIAALYAEYVNAVNILDTETTVDDAREIPVIKSMLDNVTYFAPKNNTTFAPKIGNGALQPALNYTRELPNVGKRKGEGTETWSDYANVLYTDGDSATFNKAAQTETYKTYSIWTFRTEYCVYYANTVFLYDGITTPRTPAVLGVQGHSALIGSNSQTVPQMFYETSDNVELAGYWYGNNDQNEATGTTGLYNTLQWPDPEPKTSGGVYRYISDLAGDELYERGTPWYGTSNYNYWQLYRNSLDYIPDYEPTDGFVTINSTDWGGQGSVGSSFLVGEGVAGIDPVTLNSSLSVVNYKKLLTAINTALVDNKDYLTVEYASNNALSPVFEALQEAIDFDATNLDNYDYSSTTKTFTYNRKTYTGMQAVAAEAGKKIDDLSNALDTAVPNDINAQALLLDEVIHEYVAKMNKHQGVYSDMEAAYDAYLTAKEYYYAYEYGGKREFEPTLQEVAIALDSATKAMRTVDSSNYDFVPGQAFDGDRNSEAKSEAYKSAYNGLVWAESMPARQRGDDAHDTISGRLIRLNKDYTTTYLYIPYAVGVYDGSNSATGSITVPAIIGFTSEGGSIFSGHDRYLRTYTATSSGLSFMYDWKTRVLETENEDGTVTKSAEYIEVCSLNQLLNGDTIDDSITAVANSTTAKSGVASQMRSDNKNELDDPENFYANVVNIPVPNFDSRTGVEKYYYKYGSISVQHGGATSASGSLTNASGTLSTLGLYVINFAPVKAIINANDDLMTDESFDIENYQEGGLRDYFADMDKLTAVDPANPVYDYTNDGTDAAVQCATDIYNLLSNPETPADEKVNVLDESGDYVEKALDPEEDVYDTENANGGGYYNLRDTLDNLDPDTDPNIGPCIDSSVYDRYEKAILAAQRQMAYIAEVEDEAAKTHKGYVTDYVDDYTYTNADGDTIPVHLEGVTQFDQEIHDAYATLTAGIPTRHSYGIIEGTLDRKNKVADYECKTAVNLYNDPSGHKITDEVLAKHKADDKHNVEMDVYLVLEMSYNLLDLDKYTNTRKLRDAKEEFDEAIDPTCYGAPAEMPQDYVDDAITTLLTEITDANSTEITDPDDEQNMEGKRIARHSVKFIVKNTKTGTETDITRLIVNTESPSVVVQGDDIKVPFGYNFKADASTIATDSPCTGWSVTIGDDAEKKLDITTNTLECYIQNDTVITAYYTPDATSDESQLTIKSVFNYDLHKLNYSNDATLKIDASNLNYIEINDTKVYVPNGLQTNIKGWKINGEDYLPEKMEEGETYLVDTTVGELAKDGKITFAPIAPLIELSGPYTIKLDGEVYGGEGKTYKYDEQVTVTSDDPNCYAIAVYVNGIYIPVAYGNSYTFLANSGTTDFYTLCRTETDSDKLSQVKLYHYSVMGTDVTDDYSDEEYFMMEGNLPFAYSYSECTDTEANTWTTRSIFSVNAGVTPFNPNGIQITEFGTLYSLAPIDEADFTLDNIGVEGFSVAKKASSAMSEMETNYGHQYSFSPRNPNNREMYTRAYVKYNYTFNNMKEGEDAQSTTISAVYYGNVCTAYNAG